MTKSRNRGDFWSDQKTSFCQRFFQFGLNSDVPFEQKMTVSNQQLNQMKLKKNLDPWPRVPEEPDFDGHCRELDTLYVKDLHKKVLPSLFLLLITMLPSLLCPFCPPDHSWVPPPSFPTPTIMRCVFPPPRPLWGSTILPDHYEVSLPLLEGEG